MYSLDKIGLSVCLWTSIIVTWPCLESSEYGEDTTDQEHPGMKTTLMETQHSDVYNTTGRIQVYCTNKPW